MSTERDTYPDSEPRTLLGEARARFRRAAEAEQAQRKAILEAKKFRAGDQWDEAIRIQRAGGQAIAGLPAMPARPCLTIDRVSGPVRTISNQVRQAQFAIAVLPNGGGADEETADIYKGLLRRIQNDARADDPVDWAADGAAEGGIGWFRIRADYCHDKDLPDDPVALFDQDLKIERIANNLAVYCDPSAVKPTRSDAKWLFVTEDLARDEFKRLYGADKLSTLDEFRSEGDQDGWVGDDAVRVAEYWRCEYEKRAVAALPDGSVVEKKHVPEGVEPLQERTLYIPHIKCTKMTAVHELESWDWKGSYIPFVPILGEELNVDGKAIVRGIIQPAQDAQKMVNYTFSGAVEIFALAPKSPYVGAEGQFEGFEKVWETANTFNYGYLPYKLVSTGGSPIPPPQRNVVEAPIQAAVMLMQQAEEAIKATTSIYDPSLGNTNPREKSGRAILALQQQSDQTNSNYLDNVQRALIYAGELLVELIPEYYDRPGRVVQILGIDDQPQQVMLNQPFVGQKGQAPQPVPPGMPPPPNAKHYDLKKGRYSVTVSIGKAYTTQKEEGQAVWGEVLGKNPQLMPLLGDLFFKNLDTPGAKEAAERLKRMLPPQAQDDPNSSPEVKAQMLQQQLQQAMQMQQMLVQELNEKTKLIETDTIKANQELERSKLELSVKYQIESEKIAADLQKAQLTAGYDAALTQIQAQIEELRAQADFGRSLVGMQAEQAHEAAMQGAQSEVEEEQAEAQRGHEAGMAAQQAATQGAGV